MLAYAGSYKPNHPHVAKNWVPENKYHELVYVQACCIHLWLRQHISYGSRESCLILFTPGAHPEFLCVSVGYNASQTRMGSETKTTASNITYCKPVKLTNSYWRVISIDSRALRDDTSRSGVHNNESCPYAAREVWGLRVLEGFECIPMVTNWNDIDL